MKLKAALLIFLLFIVSVQCSKQENLKETKEKETDEPKFDKAILKKYVEDEEGNYKVNTINGIPFCFLLFLQFLLFFFSG
jgi:hypothetical protein